MSQYNSMAKASAGKGSSTGDMRRINEDMSEAISFFKLS